MNYNEFKNKYLLLKRVDYDKKYGYQCIDLVQQYTKEVFGIIPNSFGGSAINGWYNKTTYSNSKWLKIPNTKTTVPLQGDIVIFDRTNDNIHGHIAIVDNANIKILTVLEQNGGVGSSTGVKEDAIRLHHYDYINPKVLGFIRKK